MSGPNPFGDQSPFGGSNPYGQPPYGAPNPYSSPNFAGGPGGRPPLGAKVMAPAIALLVVGIIGIAASLFNVAFSFQEPDVDPNAPPFLQEMQKGSAGPQAAVIQSIFVLVNAFIIFGAVQMMRLKMRVLAIAATVVAMLNIGSCCCLPGIPIGIWSIVILLMDDVKAAFDANA